MISILSRCSMNFSNLSCNSIVSSIPFKFFLVVKIVFRILICSLPPCLQMVLFCLYFLHVFELAILFQRHHSTGCAWFPLVFPFPWSSILIWFVHCRRPVAVLPWQSVSLGFFGGTCKSTLSCSFTNSSNAFWPMPYDLSSFSEWPRMAKLIQNQLCSFASWLELLFCSELVMLTRWSCCVSVCLNLFPQNTARLMH